MKMKALTENEVRAKIKALGNVPEDTKRRVVCALIGHSKVVSMFFGYVNCARCDDQIGDALMGVANTKDSVVVGHNCKTCGENAKRLSWMDLLLLPKTTTKYINSLRK